MKDFTETMIRQPMQVMIAMFIVMVSMTTQAEIYFVHNNHLGTPEIITDKDQTVVWGADYDPFGKATVDEDPDNDGVAFVDNFRFPGQYFDEETGLHYNWFRYYDPELGRYIISDRIGLAGSANTYSYVDQNPIVFFDPNGLEKLNLFNPNSVLTNEMALFMGAEAFPDAPGELLIFGHGNPTAVADDRTGGLFFNPPNRVTSPAELAEIINNEGLLENARSVTLFQCETAQGENSFAEQLSEILGLPVTGFTVKTSPLGGVLFPPNAIPVTFGNE